MTPHSVEGAAGANHDAGTSRAPGPELCPFVSCLWHAHTSAAAGPMRELALPTGRAHLVLRLSERPLHMHRSLADAAGHALSHAVVGGPRAAYYVRDISHAAESVGAMLLPGAASVLLGAEEHELAGAHTSLSDLWGTAASELRDRLQNACSAQEKLRIFEEALTQRVRKRAAQHGSLLHPAVAHALRRFAAGASVDAVVREVGYSHRHLLTLFRSQVGLSPKRYCQIERFQRVVTLAKNAHTAGLASLAAYAGYADQAHFSREFKAFAGVTPGSYLALAPGGGNHVPLPHRA